MELAELARRRPSVEWPTLALSFAIYLSWLLLTLCHASLPDWLLAILGGTIIAWHSSFQHEVLHGHPTRWKKINYALGFAPLSLWLPFEIYGKTHRRHHKDEGLTDPFDDPESKYLTQSQWKELTPIGRAIESVQSTLLGRILIGPFWMISKFLLDQAVCVIKDVRSKRSDQSVQARQSVQAGQSALKTWQIHGVGVAIVLWWVCAVCGISPLKYLVFFVYPGTAILMLRSFAEHRAATNSSHRTAIVESNALFGLIFLNNNLHAVHHRNPAVPWYLLPALYRRQKADFLQKNAGFVYEGYGQIVAQFLFKAHDQIVHPTGAVKLTQPTQLTELAPQHQLRSQLRASSTASNLELDDTNPIEQLSLLSSTRTERTDSTGRKCCRKYA